MRTTATEVTIIKATIFGKNIMIIRLILGKN